MHLNGLRNNLNQIKKLPKGTRCKQCGYWIEASVSNIRFCVECNGADLEESEKRETDVPKVDKQMRRLMGAKIDWFLKQTDIQSHEPLTCPKCDDIQVALQRVRDGIDGSCKKCKHKWFWEIKPIEEIPQKLDTCPKCKNTEITLHRLDEWNQEYRCFCKKCKHKWFWEIKRDEKSYLDNLDPDEILDVRLANGEITLEEYDSIKRTIEQANDPTFSNKKEKMKR